MIAEPKSKAGRRHIALPAALVTELREHQQAQAREHGMAGSLWRGGNWVFATEVGGPIDPRSDYRDWVSCFRTRACGLPACTTLGTPPRGFPVGRLLMNRRGEIVQQSPTTGYHVATTPEAVCGLVRL